MQIFKARGVAKFTRRERIEDSNLIEAIERAKDGLIDADLGGGLIKQRVARRGQDDPEGTASWLPITKETGPLFLLGFAKNDRGNVDAPQLADLRKLGAAWLHASREQIEEAVYDGALLEVEREEEKVH